MRVFVAAILSLVLSGCGSGASHSLGQQRLGDVIIEVQCRPVPVTLGMNEFLIIATDIHGAPVYDLLIDLRMKDDEDWRQAIQDGFSGVYRKALGVGSLRDLLRVRIKRDGIETELRFPLIQ